MKTWIVETLSLHLPASWELSSDSSERFELPGPPGFYATQEFRSWTAPGDKALNVFYWVPLPPHDLGPMKASREWEVNVGGQPRTVYETSMYMGMPQRVLVTSLELAKPHATVTIYARGLTPSEFEEILSRIRICSAP